MDDLFALRPLVYGIIQGLTEFFPISSSAHLALIPKLTKWSDPGVFFDLSMHVGTALSVTLYYHKTLKILIQQKFRLLKNPKTYKDEALMSHMMISTLVSIICIFVFESWSKEMRTTNSMASFLIFFGLFLFVADHFGKSTKDLSKDFDPKTALMIGFFQALAIFPGVSRSGATMGMARLVGVERKQAADYSFLLSLPIIMAGFFYKLPTALQSSHFPWGECIVGMVISFITGLLAIHFLLKLLKHVGFWVYAVYRVLIGAYLLIA